MCDIRNDELISIGIICSIVFVTVNFSEIGEYSNIHFKATAPLSERKWHNVSIRNSSVRVDAWNLLILSDNWQSEDFLSALGWVCFFFTSPWDELTVINIFVDVSLILKHSITPQTNKKRHNTSCQSHNEKEACLHIAGKNLSSSRVKAQPPLQLGTQIVHVWQPILHPVPSVLMENIQDTLDGFSPRQTASTTDSSCGEKPSAVAVVVWLNVFQL